MTLLMKYLKKYLKPFGVAMICLTLEAVFDLLQPTLMAKIVDVGVARKDIPYITNMGLIMLGVTAIGAMMAIVRSIIATNLSQRIGAELRVDLFSKIQTLPLKDVDRFDTGSLITRITNDVNQLQNFVMGIMRIFVKAPMLCIGSIVMAIVLDLRMALIILIIVPVISYLLYLNLKKGYPFFVRVQKAVDQVNGTMREYLSGVRVVKAYNRFDYEEARFDGSNNELKTTTKESMQLLAVFLPLITLTVNVGIVALLWFGGLQVQNNGLQVGKIIAIINYMFQILTSMVMISNIITVLVRTKTSTERIEEVLNTSSSMTLENTATNTIQELTGQMTFQKVYANYSEDPENMVLKDISFHVETGETLGIIGSTGSGKSTLIHLMTRFYDCVAGTIWMDDQPIKEMNPHAIRESVSLVPQKALLFTGTIRENILWGKADASQEEIEKVCQLAQAHEFITSFKEGYETKLGQGGVNLSGGQKQRLSIARALIRQPKILILDDCTSAVDVTTEAKIRKGIETFSRNLTTIIVAQRITSVMNANQILVLEKGEIVGKGTHADLMETCDVYQDIYMSQVGKAVRQHV